MSDDIFASTPQAIDLKKVIELSKKMVDLEQRVSDKKEELAALNTELHELKIKTIPDAMSEAGIARGEIKLEDGTKISVEDYVQGNIPIREPEKRDAAFKYLATIGGQDLAKNKLTILFERREHNQANDLKERLLAEGYEPTLAPEVHVMTLQAFIREKLRNGEDIEPEKLGCSVGVMAKATFPKGKKPKNSKAEENW